MSAIKYNFGINDFLNVPVYIRDLKHNAYLSAGFNLDDRIYHQVLQTMPNNQQRWIIKSQGQFKFFNGAYDIYTITDTKHGWNMVSGQNNDDRVWHDSPTQTPSNKMWRIVPVVPNSASSGFYLIDLRWSEMVGGSDNFDGQTHHQKAGGRPNYMWDIILADVSSYCGAPTSFMTPVCQELQQSNLTQWNNLATSYCSGADGGRSRLLTNGACSAWCKNNPQLCDTVMLNYCRANQSATECQCIYGTSQPSYLAARTRYPEIAAPVSCWAESGCQGANLIDVLVPTDRKTELQSCPNVTVMRQNIDIANSGVIGSLDVTQQQTSTTITPGAPTSSTSSTSSTLPTTTTTSSGSTYNYSGNAPLEDENTWVYILIFILVILTACGIFAIMYYFDEPDMPNMTEVGATVTQ